MPLTNEHGFAFVQLVLQKNNITSDINVLCSALYYFKSRRQMFVPFLSSDLIMHMQHSAFRAFEMLGPMLGHGAFELPTTSEAVHAGLSG